jgi:hypothetical protein
MFLVGVHNSTHFTISSNFSGTGGVFGKRSSLGPENNDLATERGDWIRILQPSIITSISSGRDSLTNAFQEQVVTTRFAHGYESGDIIQLSLHYQVDETVGSGQYVPNPQNAASWRAYMLYYGYMHMNMFEVDKKSDTTFSLYRMEYIRKVEHVAGSNDIRFTFTGSIMGLPERYFAVSGHYLEIECYECGVHGFDENVYEITGANYNNDTTAYIEVNNTYGLNFTTYTNFTSNYATMRFKTSQTIYKDNSGNEGVNYRDDHVPNGLGFTGIVIPRREVIAENLGGTFALRLDTSGTPPVAPYKCRVCAVRENAISSEINPLQSDFTQPDSLHYLLNAMNNIKLGNVTTEYIRSKPGRTTSEGVLFKITFSGNQVNGDIPLLSVSSSTLSGDQNTISVTEYYKGHQIKGQFKLEVSVQISLDI